ncbi:unnamed protein product, partial [Closterium sp. NIES-54]
DHFLSLDPTSLTVGLLEQHLLAAETSVVVVGATRGTLRPPFFEGCSPSPLAPSYASAAAADVSVAADVGAASASAKRRSGKGKGGKGGGGGGGSGGGGSRSSGGGSSGGGGGGGTGGGSGGSGGGSGSSGGSGGGGGSGTGGGGTGARRLREWSLRGASGSSCPYVIRTGDRAGQTCGRLHTQHRCFSRLDDAWRAEFGDDVKLPRLADLLKSRIAFSDLDFDAILSAMYALSVSAEGDCYRCVPPDPGIAAAALGASEFGTLPGTAPAQALHTFTLDSGASACFFCDSTTLTPLSTPVPVRLADPLGGPVVARSSTVLPCPEVPYGSLSGLHLPSFTANLVSTAALQDAMVTTTTPGGQRVLQRFGFQFSSPQPTPLSTTTSHSLSAPPSYESVEPSGPYPELVGCLMYLMTCTRPDLAYPLCLVARYVARGRHRKVHWDAAKRVLRYLCSTSQGYTFSLGSGLVSWQSTRSSSVLSSSCEAEIYAGAMAAQELRWLTYLLTDLGEQPRSPPVLYVDNKAMIALCQEHRLEHRTKHIALRYFLARELLQRGQLRLAYVATRANIADIFTKALPPGDH